MNITDISGIGDATAQRLKTYGIDSVEDVARASIEQLAAVPGIGENRAAALRRSARGLQPDAAGEESPEAAPAPAGDDAGTDGRKDGKGKKKKKGKKSGKDKKKEKKKKKGKKDKGRRKKHGNTG